MENIQNNAAAVASPVLPAKRPTAPAASSLKAVKRQSDYRLAVGLVLMALWIVAAWALDWDADWHVRVGRDDFWTPPHLVFYITVGACGIICAGVVLVETFLYRRRAPGYNDQTTTPLLFLFHGPVGFMLAGFGMAVMLASAPLDDYWHRIYGVDVKVWAPFHVMLLIGIIMASLGLVYLFASEVTRRKSWQKPPAGPAAGPLKQGFSELRGLFHPAIIGLILAMLIFLTRYLFLMGPDTFQHGTLEIGDLKLPAYSLVVAATPLLLVTLSIATGRFGVATLAGLIFLLYRQVDAPLIQWGVDYLVKDQGRTLRPGTNVVTWNWIYPIFMPLVGLVIDFAYLFTRRWRTTLSRNLLVAAGTTLATGLLVFLLEKPWEHLNDLIRQSIEATGNPTYISTIDSFLFKPDYWAALPLVVVLAALAGVVGWAFGISLRYTDR
jgi:hypothetical protein